MKKNDRKHKIKKVTKVSLPLLALFGNQGFASSRNPLSVQSSKKLAGKSVVYLQDNSAPELPALNTQKRKSTSPFAKFTNKTGNKIKGVDNSQQSRVFSFLKKNDLLKTGKVPIQPYQVTS